MLHSDTGGYKKDIVTKATTYFSRSADNILEEEYTERDRVRVPRTITKPNLVLYGTSTPGNFYKAVTNDAGVNGFLARLLVLETQDGNAMLRTKKDLAEDMPIELYNALRLYAMDPINVLERVKPTEYIKGEFAKFLHEFEEAQLEASHE